MSETFDLRSDISGVRSRPIWRDCTSHTSDLESDVSDLGEKEGKEKTKIGVFKGYQPDSVTRGGSCRAPTGSDHRPEVTK